MYNNVPKPTDASYTKVRNGYPLFDDTIVSYDDSANYFDGDNPLIYTNIPKPTGTPYTNVLKPT